MRDILMAVLYDGVDINMEDLKIELALTESTDRKKEIIKELYLLEELKGKQRQNSINSSDIFKAAVSVGSLMAVLKYEETNIITTKIWGFVTGMFK